MSDPAQASPPLNSEAQSHHEKGPEGGSRSEWRDALVGDLSRALSWVDWEVPRSQAMSATAALTEINDSDPHVRIDPRVLGARVALGSAGIAQIFSTRDGHSIDQAALLYNNVKPQEISFDLSSPSRLSVLRKTFLEALAREWRKTQIFSFDELEGDPAAPPLFKHATILNAAGKTIAELADDASLVHTPGLDGLSDEDRRDLLAEWARDNGLDVHHTIGTIEFSLASVLAQRAISRGEAPPEVLVDRESLLKAFQDEIIRWQEHPRDSFNPLVQAAFHLASSSGEPPNRKDPKASLKQAVSSFAERWNANFGKPPSFDRAAAALDILQRETGQSRDDLEYEETDFSALHAFGVTETVRVTPLARFLELADRPGVGHVLALRCEHDEHHHHHVINPRADLQRAEETFNASLPQQAWVMARAKENLRLGGKMPTPDDISAEAGRIVADYEAETEGHRDLIRGLEFLKNWYISQIPIVGGIYNIEEGIRHDDIKQIIGGALALTGEAAVAMVARRGGMAFEVTSEAEAGGSMPSAPGDLSSPSLDITSVEGQFSEAQPGQPFSDIPRRFLSLSHGERRTWDHPVTGETLTVTRIKSTGEIVALRSVPGQQRTYQAVDWINGEAQRGSELKAYHMDPQSGLIEKGGGLKGGGICCSTAAVAPSRFGEGRLPPFPERMRPLVEKAQPVLAAVGKSDALAPERSAFLNDFAGLNRLPAGWDDPAARPLETEQPLAINGPSPETLRQQGIYAGFKSIGPTYQYEGRYWSIIPGPVEEMRSYRARAAADAWNRTYQKYGFGSAEAYELSDGEYALSTPPIPVVEGVSRARNTPQGSYGEPPLSGAANLIDADELILLPSPTTGDVADRAVIEAGGHRLQGNVYWYGAEYWTFQSGLDVGERYVHAVEFARAWDRTFAEAAGSKAVVKVLWNDGSVAVLTKPVSPAILAEVHTEVAIADAAPVGPEALAAELSPGDNTAHFKPGGQGGQSSAASSGPGGQAAMSVDAIVEPEPSMTADGSRQAFWM
ncbi:hypothetical protein [Rhodoligotrophos defluvii]|uniref:hypothetical protein n=1 Tax=Rhodoligotrophos defluvii TaxID=2561934 RepID=UPI0010C99245|nr:hypothetical protein [Rhodoligotrophos defluvii]